MKVVNIERVVTLMRFIQYGWDEKRKESFDETLRTMLQTQSADTQELIKEIENLRDRYDKNDFAIRGVLEKVIEIIEKHLDD